MLIIYVLKLQPIEPENKLPNEICSLVFHAIFYFFQLTLTKASHGAGEALMTNFFPDTAL